MFRASMLLGLGLMLAGSMTAAADDAELPADPMTPITSFDYSATPVEESKLFGLIAASDHDFDCFISPMSNPHFSPVKQTEPTPGT